MRIDARADRASFGKPMMLQMHDMHRNALKLGRLAVMIFGVLAVANLGLSHGDGGAHAASSEHAIVVLVNDLSLIHI
jgi:hypothetical protein